MFEGLCVRWKKKKHTRTFCILSCMLKPEAGRGKQASSVRSDISHWHQCPCPKSSDTRCVAQPANIPVQGAHKHHKHTNTSTNTNTNTNQPTSLSKEHTSTTLKAQTHQTPRIAQTTNHHSRPKNTPRSSAFIKLRIPITNMSLKKNIIQTGNTSTGW